MTQGKEALVDDEDYERLAAFKWHAIKQPKSRTWYATRCGRGPSGKRTTIIMHREIMRPGSSSVEVDHRDRDGLNNRRENLRLCSKQQNACNRVRSTASKSSRFKGVTWYTPTRRWKAQIQRGGKRVGLGYFPNEVEAAKAYDRAATLSFGEFAALNFPAESSGGKQAA